jgi:hypothetical protein
MDCEWGGWSSRPLYWLSSDLPTSLKGEDVSTELPEGPLPFPTQVGGSKVTGDRVTGPPSKVFPLIRDLVESDYEVIVEIDTEKERRRGMMVQARDVNFRHRSEEFYLISPPRGGGKGDPADWQFDPSLSATRTPIKFDRIIALRVLVVRRTA